MRLEFEELYLQIEQNQKENFAEISKKVEKEKKENMKLTIIICIILDLIIFLKFLYIIKMERLWFFQTFILCLFVDLVVFVLINFIRSNSRNEYNKLFKENIISALINNFYDDLCFNAEAQIPSSVYNEARYTEYYNRYTSEDYFKGKIENKYEIEMAEVKTEKEETHRDSKGRTRVEKYVKFHGLFAKIKMDKSIQTSLQIRGNFQTSINRVKMDSQEFEKYFDVASDNKIITMQILTHDVMEMLISFLRDNNMQFDINIYGDRLYVRFATGDIFEAVSLKEGRFDKTVLKKYYDVLEFTYVIARKMIEVIEDAKI